jgi:predicted outer membrane repeat protein
VIDGGQQSGRFATVANGARLTVDDHFTFQNFNVMSDTTHVGTGGVRSSAARFGQHWSVDVMWRNGKGMLIAVFLSCIFFASGGVHYRRLLPFVRNESKARVVVAVGTIFVAAVGMSLSVFASSGGNATVSSGENFTVPASQNYSHYNVGTTSSDYGGVFYADGGTLVIGNDCIFSSNTAGWGGAIYVTSSGDVQIGDSCLFSDNEAGYVCQFLCVQHVFTLLFPAP